MDFISGNPTWDLMLGAILAIFIVYGFIIGQAKTFKTLLSLYPAFFIADILGGFLPQLFPDLKIAFINNQEIATLTLSEQTDSLQVIIITKLVIFLIFWLLIVVKSPFTITAEENGKKIGNIFLHFLLSLSFGVLLINILLLIFSGFSIFGDNPSFYILEEIMKESFLVTLFVQFSGSWFAFPALFLGLSGFLHSAPKGEEPDEGEEEEKGE